MSNTTHETDVEQRADPNDACRIGAGEVESNDTDTSHLDGLDDGCGCAEIWEHLSEQRDE